MIDNIQDNTKQLQQLMSSFEYDLQKNVSVYLKRLKNQPMAGVDKGVIRNKSLQNIQALTNAQYHLKKQYMPLIETSVKYEIARNYDKGVQLTDKQLSGKSKKARELTESNRLNKLLEDTRVRIETAINGAIADSIRKYSDTINRALETPRKTLYAAIDVARAVVFLAGIQAVRYKGGGKVSLGGYTSMVTRESSHKSLLVGEGDRKDDYGKYYVYITGHSASCPLCRPYQNKILIDDVNSNGKPDGKHTLLSEAIANGLFHFNCRHNALPFDLGKDKKPPLAKDISKTRKGNIDNREEAQRYKATQRVRAYQNMIRKQKAIRDSALSSNGRQAANERIKLLQGRIRGVESQSGVKVYRQSWREDAKFKFNKSKPFITQEDIDKYNLGELGGRWSQTRL